MTEALYWMDRPVDEMTREELLQVVYAMAQAERQHAEMTSRRHASEDKIAAARKRRAA